MKIHLKIFAFLFGLAILSLTQCGEDKKKSFGCAANTQQGTIDFKLEGDALTLIRNGKSSSLKRVSGSTGSVHGEWDAGTRSGDSLSMKIFIIISSSSLTTKAVCSDGSETKTAEATAEAQITDTQIIIKETKRVSN